MEPFDSQCELERSSNQSRLDRHDLYKRTQERRAARISRRATYSRKMFQNMRISVLAGIKENLFLSQSFSADARIEGYLDPTSTPGSILERSSIARLGQTGEQMVMLTRNRAKHDDLKAFSEGGPCETYRSLEALASKGWPGRPNKRLKALHP